MITIGRDEAKRDPVYSKLLEFLKNGHQVADHTQEVLRKNVEIKDFCEEARHYGTLQGKDPMWIHYDVCTWLENELFIVRIESICFYDSYDEYEAARQEGLFSGKYPSCEPKH